MNIKENINCFIYRNLIYILYSILTISLILSPSLINTNHILANERKPLIYPLKAEILVHFNEKYVDEDTGETHRHCGIDIAGNKGDKVIASAPGKVFYVGWTPTGGKTISICHLLNVKTTYLNLQDYHVSVGQEVKRGQVIGTIGAEDDISSGEVHLHFGVIVNNHYVDPEKILEMDFNDLTKFISLTYTELDEGMNVELKPGHVDIEKLNYVADKNSNNVIDTESFYNIDLNSIYYEYPGAIFNSYENLNNLKIYENSNENSHSLFSNIKNKIFKIFHLDNDKDGIVFWNDPDDDNDGISDKQESDPIDLDVYTGLGKDKIQSSVISSIYNKYNPNKNDDYIIVVGGFGGDTHDVKNSILMKNLEDNKYPWSKMAWFSWNGPGTEHNAYESQKDYEKFRNSMIEYLDEIPDGEKTDLIGYSNGGRLELEFVLDKRNKKCMDKIDKLITINSPIKGTNSKLSKLQRDPFIKKLYGFLLPDLNWLPFPEIDPESPALYNLSSYSPSSLKLAYPDKYGNKNDDGSLYRPNVEIINIASRWDLVVEDFGIKNQIYKYADKVYINYEAILPSHFFNLRDKDTLELILNILNHNKIDKEITKEGYIIYGKEDYSEFYNVYKGEI